MGVWLKLKFTLIYLQADSMGLRLKGCKILRVVSVCYRRSYLFYMEMYVSVVHSHTIKFSLDLMIARSYTLWKCIPGGKIWKSMFFSGDIIGALL